MTNGKYQVRFNIAVNFKMLQVTETFIGYADSLSWLGGLFASLLAILQVVSPCLMLFYLMKLTKVIKEVYAQEYKEQLKKSLLKYYGKMEDDRGFRNYLEASGQEKKFKGIKEKVKVLRDIDEDGRKSGKYTPH